MFCHIVGYLVDARIRASNKDFPVQFFFSQTKIPHYLKKEQIMVAAHVRLQHFLDSVLPYCTLLI